MEHVFSTMYCELVFSSLNCKKALIDVFKIIEIDSFIDKAGIVRSLFAYKGNAKKVTFR